MMNRLVIGVAFVVILIIMTVGTYAGHQKTERNLHLVKAQFPESTPPCLYEQTCFIILTKDIATLFYIDGQMRSFHGVEYTDKIESVYYNGKVFKRESLF